MTWRDRDGELHDEPPAWTEPRSPRPTDPHTYRPDASALSCDLCALPRHHPRHPQESPMSRPSRARDLALVRHALGLKLALELSERTVARAESIALLDALAAAEHDIERLPAPPHEGGS